MFYTIPELILSNTLFHISPVLYINPYSWRDLLFCYFSYFFTENCSTCFLPHWRPEVLCSDAWLFMFIFQDWFTVSDRDGKCKERYLFLFKARILICKVRHIADDRSVFVLKDIVRVSSLILIKAKICLLLDAYIMLAELNYIAFCL